MTIDQMIAVLEGAKAGKPVEYRYAHAGIGPWLHILTENVTWNFRDFEYRLKPSPREFWVNFYNSGAYSVYTSRESADMGHLGERVQCIHVREVMEDSQ